MKKLLSAVMALVMVLSLTACGDNGSGDNESGKISSMLEGSWVQLIEGSSKDKTVIFGMSYQFGGENSYRQHLPGYRG